MATARYWRVVGLQSVNGGALELSALHLYSGGVRIDETATLTSTFAPDSGSLANLQDTDTATIARWLNVSAPGFALVWDFGLGSGSDVRAVRLGAGALYTEWLETLTMQYSSDGIGWVTTGSITAFTWAGSNAMQAVPADGDPDFHKVSLLLHCDGANGSTAFTDSSAMPKTVTANGTTKVSTAQSKFGGACLALDGNYSGLAVDVSESLRFGSSDFTIEFWLRTSKSAQVSAYPRVLSVGIFQQDGGWSLVYFKSEGRLHLDFYAAGATAFNMWCGIVSDNTWTHVAITRSGSTVRSFLDGVLTNSASTSAVLTSTVAMAIGAETASGNSAVAGFIDDLRITKGVSRYSADFTPPTAPYVDSAFVEYGAVAALPIPRIAMPFRTGIVATSAVPPHSAVSAPRLQVARNIFAGGDGTIRGTVERKSDPINVMLRRRVRLYDETSGNLVQQTWSDAKTGEFIFRDVAAGARYTTIAYDYEHNFRAEAADNLSPEVLT